MYVTNPSTLIKIFKCGKMVSNYLIKKGIPLLSQDEDGFYFSQTQDLANVLNKAPWYVRMVVGEWT